MGAALFIQENEISVTQVATAPSSIRRTWQWWGSPATSADANESSIFHTLDDDDDDDEECYHLDSNVSVPGDPCVKSMLVARDDCEYGPCSRVSKTANSLRWQERNDIDPDMGCGWYTIDV